MNISTFRELFEHIWHGYPEDVKKCAWMACFRRSKRQKNGILSGRAVQIYRILRALKPTS